MAAKSDYILCEGCTHTTNVHDEDGVCHAYLCTCEELKLKKGTVIPSDTPVYHSGSRNRPKRVRMG